MSSRTSAFAGMLLMRRRLTKWKGSRSSLSNSKDKDSATQRPKNTYQLGPAETQRFSQTRASDVIAQVQRRHLGSLSHVPADQTAQLSRTMAEEVKAEIKSLGYNRHKVVVHVTLGDNSKQGVQVASRCVWDTTSDTVVSVTHEHHSVYCVITVYAVYYE